MKHYPKTHTTLCGLLIPALLPAAGGAPNHQQPNIILIMADDLGFSDIGCYGSEIATPHLDKLAKEGLRFSQFYNASRSCPTRASLLTGLYQHQAGVGDMMNNLGHPSYQGYINTSCVTLAEVLKSAGYSTFMSGKWHVGNRPETLPVRRGFDRYFGNVDGAGSYFERIPYRMNQKAPRMMLDSADYEPPRNNFYFTNAIVDYALEFIGQRDASRPFFLYLAFTAPHWPLHALPEDIQKYRGKYRTGWDDIRNQRYKKMNKLGLFPEKYALSARDAQVRDWKLVSRFDTGRKKQGPWELYNIKQDRTEQQEVSAENPERTQKMIEEYEQWAERVGVVEKERLF